MPLFLDAETDNADWIKPAWFDLRITTEEAETLDIEDLEFLTTLPSWEAAPKAIVEITERRLAEVAD